MSGCKHHDGDDGDDDDGDGDLNDHHFIITLASWPPRILPPPLLPHWQLRTPEDIIFAFAFAIAIAIVFIFVFVFVIVFFLVRLCILITLIKCLKDHKSLGSLLEGAL